MYNLFMYIIKQIYYDSYIDIRIILNNNQYLDFLTSIYNFNIFKMYLTREFI